MLNRTPKKGPFIPYGWKECEDDPSMLESIPIEIEALRRGILFVQDGRYSYKGIAAWISKHAGRTISAQGLQTALVRQRKYDIEHPEEELTNLITTDELPSKRKGGGKPTRSDLGQKSNKKAKKKYEELAAARRERVKQRKARENKFENQKNRVFLEEAIQDVSEDEQDVVFKPSPGPQTDFLAATEDQVFFGGARGGGKSYALIADPMRYFDNGNFRGLLIRRTFNELRDLISHSKNIYPKAYPGAKWRDKDKEWVFPSGANFRFGYAENMDDLLQYQGQQYCWIGIDELPQYPTSEIISILSGSLRSADPTLPKHIRMTGNPGNIGSAWVKSMFIDPSEPNIPFTIPITLPGGKQGGITRRFIPATVYDNPYLMHDDSYLTMLAGLPEVKRKQWLEGDWTAFDSCAFPEFNPGIHTVDYFEIPSTWPRYRSADWGYSSHACVLWFALSPDGCMYIYRELYIKDRTADEFAYLVLEMEQGEFIKSGIMDSSVWAKRGEVGPSPIETMSKMGLRWKPADRSPGSRVHGKLEIHKRLRIDSTTGNPSLKIFKNCSNLIRTLPILPVCPNNEEDVDTKSEDHAYDALRYGCAFKPKKQSSIDDLFITNMKFGKRNNKLSSTFGY